MQKSALIALVLALVGIIFLALYLLLPINIITLKEPNQIKTLVNNQKIIIEGKVISEKNLSNTKLLIMSNNISIYSPSKRSYLDKIISISGIVTDFYGNKSVQVLKIKTLK